jgi:hypothetical protein
MNIVIELLYGLNMKTCSYVEFSLLIIMFKHLLWLKTFEVNNVILISC